MGLGNPGYRYQATRHNVGFEIVERILRQTGGGWSGASDDAVYAEVTLDGHEVTLLKPLTYMNLSGAPVKRIAQREGLSPEQVLVYYDDVALPLGALRLRERGSAGGHRGMQSIVDELGSQDVARMRMGIRPQDDQAQPDDLATFVLERFSEKEEALVEKVLERALAATLSILSEGMGRSMSRYNATAV